MNKEIKIGIIGGSSGDALATAVKNMGYKSVLIAGKEGERGLDIADESYIIDLKEREKIANLLLSETDSVVIGTGHKYAHEIAKDLFDKGMGISIDPYKAEYGKDKLKAYKKIRELGYNTPEYHVVENGSQINESLLNSLPIPCVVKSVDDAVRTAKANNVCELQSLLLENMEANSSAIVEEFIEGVEATIPILSDGEEVVGVKRALDMPDINRIAVDHLRNFNNMDAIYNRFDILTDDVKNEIVKVTEDIIRKIGLIGVPRFDLMITPSKEIYVLEINEVAVSRFGPAHYPWELVDFNMAEEMIKIAVKRMVFNKGGRYNE